MGLEAIPFHQDPFAYGYGYIDSGHNTGAGSGGLPAPWDPRCTPVIVEADEYENPNGEVNYHTRNKRRRTRTKVTKKKGEIENQRMTHIAVERNRRRQMNDYLAILRTLMPPSYAQRGDQASIVGGAINFVKELEQLLQFLEANHHRHHSIAFSDFFSFPQYSQFPADEVVAERPGIADIEVAMAESHANIKILTKRRPKQLLKLVAQFHSIGLTPLHLSLTTLDQSILYSFNVKVEDECELTTMKEIANTVHDIMGMIEKNEGVV